MSHLSGLLIVLGLSFALIEGWPWSLLPLGVAAWLWFKARRDRPQDREP